MIKMVNMNSSETENICKYLKNKDIQLSSNNPWLISCINWYKSHLELSSIYGTLQEYVCIQWLLADLQDVHQGCLPNSCKDGNTELAGKYHVQINWVRDIGQSCYTQLQATQNTNMEDSNDKVTAEDQKKQNWEPNPKRVLMMEVTDGIITLKAFEYSPIPKLFEPFIPGLKVVLCGPIECRKGILFLKNNNISLLGGEVDNLYEVNSKESLLSRCLNITTNNNVIQERDIHNTVVDNYRIPNVVQTNRSETIDTNQLPDSTTMIEHNNFVEDSRNILMSDEDEDFLRQLPDEVLDCVDNIDPEPSSPILDRRPLINNSRISYCDQNTLIKNPFRKSPVLCSKPQGLSKPKLFPSLENLQSTDTEMTNAGQSERLPLSTLPNDVLPKTQDPGKVLKKISNISHNNLYSGIPSTSSESINITNQAEKMSLNSSSGSISFNNSSLENHRLQNTKPYNSDLNVQKHDEDTEDIICIDEITFPQFKKHEIKVDSITKLKIRSGEWYCCATVLCGTKSLNVTFSNQVLEQLFGIPASEVEVWRGEMATNPSLKKKVNDILKAGQTKLKILNCPMTLEYVSEDCTPHVIDIHIT